jgi:hypothetical protein
VKWAEGRDVLLCERGVLQRLISTGKSNVDDVHQVL